MKMAHQYVVSAAAACAFMLVLMPSAQSSHETSNKNMRIGSEDDGWKFLKSYPRHVLAQHANGSDVVIDGKLDDEVWRSATTHTGFTDIHNYSSPSENKVPEQFQVYVAFAYTDTHLLVGARLRAIVMEQSQAIIWWHLII